MEVNSKSLFNTITRVMFGELLDEVLLKTKMGEGKMLNSFKKGTIFLCITLLLLASFAIYVTPNTVLVNAEEPTQHNRIKLAKHIVNGSGVTKEQIESWVAKANEIWNCSLILEDGTPDTINETDIGKIKTPGAIDVFGVSKARGEAGDYYGACWDQQRIEVCQDANEFTFAHEIGHWFGLDDINDTSNIMHYTKKTGSPDNTDAQQQVVRANCSLWLNKTAAERLGMARCAFDPTGDVGPGLEYLDINFVESFFDVNPPIPVIRLSLTVVSFMPFDGELGFVIESDGNPSTGQPPEGIDYAVYLNPLREELHFEIYEEGIGWMPLDPTGIEFSYNYLYPEQRDPAPPLPVRQIIGVNFAVPEDKLTRGGAERFLIRADAASQQGIDWAPDPSSFLYISKEPLQWFMKPPFPDYVPSGMPDFDQRQGGTYLWQDSVGRWSHCGPVAVANSLWWLDSEFETNIIPPPTIIDNYPLVKAYGPWDDHDSLNVQPLVEHLAYLMDTDGLRTGIAKLGTNVFDMQAGITHYLSWSGVNPLGDVDGDGIVTQNDEAIVLAAMGTTPGMPGWDIRADIFPVTTLYPPFADNIIDQNDHALVQMNMGLTGMFYEHTVMAPPWELIVDEVMRCQDVVLLIAPWIEIEPGVWIRYDEAAHYVTVAGLNATTWEIVLSDPINDNAEAGGPGNVPVPHVHPPPEPPYVTHNDARLVSHDMYKVIMQPCPGGPLALIGYPGSIMNPLGSIWQIEAAVITCPYEMPNHDVAVTDIVTSKTGCLPMPTVGQGYNVQVNVTVENQGDSAETFNVTLYANSTIIGTQTVSGLPSGMSFLLVFDWDTEGFAYGNYTLSAYAWPVLGETDLADNTLIDDWVIVTIPGDVDGNFKVEIFDVVRITGIYGVRRGDPRYNPNADLDGDGDIDIFDVVGCTGHYGQHYP